MSTSIIKVEKLTESLIFTAHNVCVTNIILIDYASPGTSSISILCLYQHGNQCVTASLKAVISRIPGDKGVYLVLTDRAVTDYTNVGIIRGSILE